MLDVFVDTPTGNQRGPPSTRFARAEQLHPFGVRLRSARYASPQRGEAGGKKDNLQKQVYTGQAPRQGRRCPYHPKVKLEAARPKVFPSPRTLRSCKLLLLHQNRLHLLQMLRQHVRVRHNRGVVPGLAFEQDVVDELLAQLSDAASRFGHLPDLSILNS